MRKFIQANAAYKSEADIYKKLWNKNVATSYESLNNQNLNFADELNKDEPAPLFASNNENDGQIFLNDYYKLSSNRRNRRTMYSRNYVDNFASDTFSPKANKSNHNDITNQDKTLKETRIKSWFDNPCYQFNSSDRITQLIKSKAGNKQSVEDRFKIYQRSNDYKLQKANNNSSIDMIENLAKKNSNLIQDFKRKYS
jgi:phenolic acid decarboxylase